MKHKLKYIKDYKSFKINEELDIDTYQNASSDLRDLGFNRRANDLLFHSIKMKYPEIASDIIETLEYHLKDAIFIDNVELTITLDGEQIIELDDQYLYIRDKYIFDIFDDNEIDEDEDRVVILMEVIENVFGVIIDFNTDFVIVKDYLLHLTDALEAVKYTDYNIHPIINIMLDINHFIEDCVYEEITNNPFEDISYMDDFEHAIYSLYRDDETIFSFLDEDMIEQITDETLSETDVTMIFNELEDHNISLYEEKLTEILTEYYKGRWGDWNEYITELYGENHTETYPFRNDEKSKWLRNYINTIVYTYCDVEKINDELKYYYENDKDEYYGMCMMMGYFDFGDGIL